MDEGARVISGDKCMTKKEKRKDIKVPEELWVIIKAAAKANGRTIKGELEQRFK